MQVMSFRVDILCLMQLFEFFFSHKNTEEEFRRYYFYKFKKATPPEIRSIK